MAGSVERALLERVWADPLADDPRRVLADWWLARGDPRGEFVTLQLDRARGRRQLEALVREQALLAEHREAWLGPLAGSVGEVVFERGFPARAVLQLGRPPAGASLRDPAWATVVELFAHNWRDVDVTDVLARLLAGPCTHLSRLAAPLSSLLTLTDGPRRAWTGVVVTDLSWSPEDLVTLSARLPALDTIGVATCYAGWVRGLCGAALRRRIRRLELVVEDDLHGTTSGFTELFAAVEPAWFDELLCFDASAGVGLVVGPGEAGRMSAILAHPFAIDESLLGSPVADRFDPITLIWAPGEDGCEEEAAELVRALGSRVRVAGPGATSLGPFSGSLPPSPWGEPPP